MATRFTSFLLLCMLPACVSPGAEELDSPGGKADTSEVRYIENSQEIDELVVEVMETSLPELPGDRVSSRSKRGKATVFFWARPKIGSIVNPFSALRYQVFHNTRLFEDGTRKLPYEAARSIIAHELVHLYDYEFVPFGLLRTGWTQIVRGKVEARNERRTDLTTIALGYAEGLKLYRDWIYSGLEGDDLESKRATYFTPEEIHVIDWALSRYPDLFAHWHKHPPLNLETIEADIAALDANAALPVLNECEPSEIACADGSCIDSAKLCDGTADCPGGEDESTTCIATCTEEEFACGSGECLPGPAECDGIQDCFDYTDELHCED